jgi:hypothetical protein
MVSWLTPTSAASERRLLLQTVPRKRVVTVVTPEERRVPMLRVESELGAA